MESEEGKPDESGPNLSKERGRGKAYHPIQVQSAEAENGRALTEDNSNIRFPIVDVDLLRAYLRSEGAPTVLVAFEFSGSLRRALKTQGVHAISADERESEEEGPHFQGEVRDIMPMKEWDAVYCVGPNCYQTLRADKDCLQYKIMDGRAFWGAATVLWCLCRPNAKMLLVEQPDTITIDYLPTMRDNGVEAVELRTSQYGDAADKFMRLMIRNMNLPRPTGEAVRQKAAGRTQFAYSDPDERDRKRSTWKNYPNMCEAIARATAKTEPPPQPPDYRWAVEQLAQAWRGAGHPVPLDYANPDARPSEQSERDYQKVRGRGDGRRPPQATPKETDTSRHQGLEVERSHEPQEATGDRNAPRELTHTEPTLTANIVVPVRVEGNEIMALTPNEEAKVLSVQTVARATKHATIADAEEATWATVGGSSRPIGYRAANTADGKKVMVTLCKEKGRHEKAATVQQRPSGVARAVKGVMWCTLAALTVGHPQTTWTKLAICSATQFMAHDGATFRGLLDEAHVQDQLAAAPGRGAMMGPRRQLYQDPRSITPRQMIDRANGAVEELRGLLQRNEGPMGAYLAEWADTIQPLNLAEVPGELLDKPLGLDSMGPADQLYAERLPVYELPWLDRMPQQRPLPTGCENFRPRSARDLLNPRAMKEVEKWMQQAQLDLQCLEEKGPDCERQDRPRLLALGDEDMRHCAKGRVWDCRERNNCTLLDYQAPMKTALNIPRLKELFRGYPDQRLASNVLEGVRLEADIEHQVVLHPNLMSVGEGYDSVQRTVRELAAMGFYEMYDNLPYVPIVVTGQGARIKKLGVKKYRRTSDFSAPHRDTQDRSGHKVIGINDASRSYHYPEWLRRADDELKSWDADRYAHVQWTDAGQRQAPVRFKFPKEMKPRLSHVMNDAAVLLKAAVEMEESLFVWVEDAAYYFNQFAYAPEELWKSTLIVGAREGDTTQAGEQLQSGQPAVVAENRLGFGSFASSNVAQRFSNALVQWTLQEFDRLEDEARDRQTDAKWERWRRMREPLEQRCANERPKKKGQAVTDCTQTRLAVIHMYTDDPIIIVVGTERTLRMLQAWHHVIDGTGVQMAGAEKRQLGGHVDWIGITVLAAIGLVVVPRAKLMRAREGLVRALKGEMTFGEYRALIGLLEHLRFIAQLEADSTNALYKPHGKNGASAFGPSAIVTPDPIMVHKLNQWITIIMTCAGATVTMIFADTAAANWRAGHDAYVASADAAGDGKGSPGFGGYIHGFWWRVPLAAHMLKAMHITAWETLATAVNALVADRITGPEGALLLKADAALVPYVLSQKKSTSEHVQLIIHELHQVPEYVDRITRRMAVQHVSGESNIMSDLVSRGLWDDFEQLCVLLNIKPQEVKLEQTESKVITNVLNQIDPRASESMLDYLNRERSQAERGLAKARSDCTDGDGPFTPPWVKTQQREANSSKSPQKHGAPPTPPPPGRPQHRLQTPSSHPYLTPTAQRQLGPAQESATQRLVERLTNDRSQGRIRAPPEEITALAKEVAQAKADGLNPRTAKKDDLAWREWVKYAEMRGFNPNLRTAWTRAFPERECLKLTGFVLYTAQTMKPRAKKDTVAKPLSVHQRYLALRRTFKAQDIELPPDSAVQAVIKGLIRRYIRLYGIADLRPNRVEPITPTIVQQLVTQAEKGSTRVGGRPWRIQDTDCFNVTAWQVINLQVGSRKGEATKLPGDIDHNDWFTRASVTYRRAGRVVTQPTTQDLRGMTEGDCAMLAPKGAKCDQWGSCHGTEPIILPYHNSTLNPAKWLVKLELARPCSGEQRETTPLFAQDDGSPYTDAHFSRLIKGSLENALGATRARLYSPHSWRVWLASALRMAGASDARIQAFGRWLNPESIKIYSRITTNEYAHWMDKIMNVRHLDTARTNNLPIMDAADALAMLQEHEEGHESTPQPTERRRKSKHTPPAQQRSPDRTSAPRKKRNAAKARTASARLTTNHQPTIDYRVAKTTTGVGSLTHKFPPSLEGYTTYNKRPSKRPPPTERIKE